ncbi:type VI secretion system accessory protein TagJ [Frateuria sp. GZRe12]|uniref:type VI secretion system accessory protein TagJ n=1 Tax=Frateuria sp. GZRe12 TaxID=3351533 RepID=UPI003EDBEE0D
MTPENMLKEGRLDEALQGLTSQVRNNPADARCRVFLFQLLALLGQWDRAQAQLKVSGDLDVNNTLMAGAYAQALRGEMMRVGVLAGERMPSVVGEPSQWMALLLQALRLDAQGQHAQAAPLREQAFELAPTVSGEIDGEAFEWIADADPRFGPCLEMVVNGGYAWVPFDRLKQLAFEAPTDLRDKIWAPVQVTWSNGGQAVGFVPCRYPASERSADAEVVLARRTDWEERDCGLVVGLGQRMFATDAGEYSLLDVRTIVFNNDPAA